MKLKSKAQTSFFRNNVTHTADELQQLHNAAAETIQHWWKQTRLKKTAIELFQYVHHVVSLQQAQKKSYATLEAFILDEHTQKTAHNLLMHLEQAKDVLLPLDTRKSLPPQAERQFLAAYLIATKSQYVLESATEVDQQLLNQAKKMLQLFEELCQVLGAIYLEHNPNRTGTPIEGETVFDTLMLEYFAQEQHNKLSEAMIHNKEFIEHLDQFHQSQLAYYETYSRWEPYNRDKLVKIFIVCYLELETKRFIIINNLDPRQLELYEGYGNQQETLKKKIELLLRDEGLEMLESDLSKLHSKLEANKWIMATTEWLSHEVALNPEFKLHAQDCAIQPQKDIEFAIDALAHEPPDIKPSQNVIEEIWNQLALFTPHNKKYIAILQHDFNKQSIKTLIDEQGLQKGFNKILCSLIEKIREREDVRHNEETDKFLEALARHNDLSTNLKSGLEFIYAKLSQINLEMSTFYIKQKQGIGLEAIVSFEQQKFQERLSNGQFNLACVLGWIDKIVLCPEEYRLNMPILCSRHIGSHLAQTLLLSVLQQPEHSVLQTIPETFYLDRIRLVDWHAQYQNILCAAICMGYFETYTKKYHVLLSQAELVNTKNELIAVLNTGLISTAVKRADHLISMIQNIPKHKIQLTSLDQKAFRTVIEDLEAVNNPVTKLFNKRLGAQLFSFLQGHQLNSPHNKTKFYGLYENLQQLSQKIIPKLNLHAKVHGAFYQQHVEERLWNPLFITLRTSQLPEKFPTLLASEQSSVQQIHASLHKMAFVLSGLALIQQTVLHTDIWSSNTIDNSTLKEQAYSSGLIAMVHNPDVSKDTIKDALIKLMNELNVFPTKSIAKIVKMIDAAKNEQTQACKAFQDEFSSLYRQMLIQGKELSINANNLTAEFQVEIQKMGDEIKEIMVNVKRYFAADDVDQEKQVLPVLRSGR